MIEAKKTLYTIMAAGITMMTGCSAEKRTGSDSDTTTIVQHREEAVHADNDIAMTIRSIVDAINYDEQPDSAAYTYTGILTDGTGKPLYTDGEGAPGVWEVKYVGAQSISLRNVKSGDLLPEELCAYIVESLGLDYKEPVTSRIYKDMGEEEPTNVRIYDFGKGLIHFETREEDTIGGTSGTVLSILISGSGEDFVED